MGRIALLSDEVIDKIAAGEVVESPAAVVKELVENSLDAGATQIRIEIRGGGQQLIRVDDDGMGMEEEDAILSLKRHTTSKITAAHDLFALDTMGFRGEALASIAAVSKLTLTTTSVAVFSEGGKIVRVEPAAREKGTSLEVRSLFYNTTARKQFQKSAAASLAEIIRLVIALSLAHPDKQFELISHEDTVIKAWKGDESLGLRVKSVLGETFFSQACGTEVSEGPYKISGFFGKPSFVRQNRLGQYLFINKRWIQSPFISASIKEAYGTYIPERSYPHFILHFTIPKDHVDVNVHPQKKEVRLKEQSFLKELIQRAFAQTFEKPTFSFQETPSFQPTSFSFREEHKFEERVSQLSLLPDKPMLEILALLHSYAIAKNGGELILIDLKSVYARVLFETMQTEKKEEGCALLIPLTLQMDKEMVLLCEKAPLAQIGLEVRVVGEETIAIDAYPSVIREKDIHDFLIDLLNDNPIDLLREKSRRLALFATRFAKGRKTPFVKEEVYSLWKALQQTKSSLFCPMGRPTSIPLTDEDLKNFMDKR